MQMNEPVSKPRRGRPSDPAKKTAIVHAAACLFMEQGFHHTSMDQIAQSAGVSKLTLYHRFADKEALFAAMIQERCQHYLPDDLFAAFDHMAFRPALLQFGAAFLRLLTSPESLAMHRLLMAEAHQNPNLSQLFYQSGPMRVKTALLEKFSRCQHLFVSGALSPGAARDLLLALFAGSDLYLRAMLHPGMSISDDEISNYAIQAVDFFMKSLD